MADADIEMFDRAKVRAVQALNERRSKPWLRCPSTHCERREECASPNECIVGNQK